MLVHAQILNVIRAIPELMLAIVIMLPIFGLGPWPARSRSASARSARSASSPARSSRASTPDLSRRPGRRAPRPLQILSWGSLPQVMPEVVAFWLYRFEINIRAGAILGVVSAGGIGSLLSQVFGRRLWERAGILLLVIILVTIAVDLVSARLRKRIIAGPDGDAAAVDDEDAGTHAGAYV